MPPRRQEFMPRKTRRISSDALYKLCKRFGARALEMMADGKRLGREHSLKIRMIEYYTGWVGEWSRVKEVKDWKGHNLASLKHRVYKHLVQLASEVEEWPEKPLNQILANITWAVRHREYDLALDLCSTAIPLAMEIERYNECIVILQLEREALERLGEDGDEEAELLAENLRNMADCKGLLLEVLSMEDFRAKHYEPFKRNSASEGSIGASRLRGLAEAISQIDSHKLLTVRAKLIYLSVEVPYYATTRREDKAYESSRQLLQLYKQNKWLTEEKRTDFLYHSGVLAVLAARNGDQKEALEIVAGMNELASDHGIVSSGDMHLLAKTNILVGINLGEVEIVSEGLRMFKTNEKAIRETLNPKKLTFLYFSAVVGSTLVGDWKTGAQYCFVLIDMKSVMLKRILANVRVIRLLCLLHLPDGMDQIISEADPACKFLRRQEGDQTYLLRMAQATKRIAAILPDDKIASSLAVKGALAESLRLRDSPSGQDALLVFNYIKFFENYLVKITYHL